MQGLSLNDNSLNTPGYAMELNVTPKTKNETMTCNSSTPNISFINHKPYLKLYIVMNMPNLIIKFSQQSTQNSIGTRSHIYKMS